MEPEILGAECLQSLMCTGSQSEKEYFFLNKQLKLFTFIDAELLRQPYYLVDIRSFDVGIDLAFNLVLLVEQTLCG